MYFPFITINNSNSNSTSNQFTGSSSAATYECSCGESLDRTYLHKREKLFIALTRDPACKARSGPWVYSY